MEDKNKDTIINDETCSTENCSHEDNNKTDNNISNDMMEQLNFLNNEFEKKIKEFEDKIIHLKKENLANLDNLKKQFEREKDDLKKYLYQKCFEDLLIVLDSLQIGINSKPDNYEKFIDGLKMTNNIFINILNKYGVSQITTNTGDDFNDTYHECMGTSEEGDNNKIINILSTGYKFNDRILRPTKVIVGTK